MNCILRLSEHQVRSSLQILLWPWLLVFVKVVDVEIQDLEAIRVAQMASVGCEIAQACKIAYSSSSKRKQMNLETRFVLANAYNFTATDFIQVKFSAHVEGKIWLSEQSHVVSAAHASYSMTKDNISSLLLWLVLELRDNKSIVTLPGPDFVIVNPSLSMRF